MSRLPVSGSVFGVDVGFSLRRRSTAACRLDWDAAALSWRLGRSTAEPLARAAMFADIAGDRHLLAAAFDGPLRRGLDIVGRYRAAERLLTRRLAARIGKPGQSSTPVGRALNAEANACARAVLEIGRVAAAPDRSVAIAAEAIAESFPTAFLGLLLEDPGALAATRADRSDRFFVAAASPGGPLERLVARLLPGRAAAPLAAIRDHDERAALVSALAALCLAAGDFVAVGDAADGFIILPPDALIDARARRDLDANEADDATGRIVRRQPS